MKLSHAILLICLVVVSPCVAQGPDTVWTRTYGTDVDESLYGMDRTTDGGFVLAGAHGIESQGLEDFYLVRTDSGGNQLWSRTYHVRDWGNAWAVH
jgi:hypothetical protein